MRVKRSWARLDTFFMGIGRGNREERRRGGIKGVDSLAPEAAGARARVSGARRGSGLWRSGQRAGVR
jgi:hypothetical protein